MCFPQPIGGDVVLNLSDEQIEQVHNSPVAAEQMATYLRVLLRDALMRDLDGIVEDLASDVVDEIAMLYHSKTAQAA